VIRADDPPIREAELPQARTPERAERAPAPAARPSAGRIPDFYLVGHPKCGTTALYEALREHPQVFMPACKEPWFFASELHLRTPPRPEGTPRTLAEYRSLFAAASPQQLVGEASPLYLWSRTAAERIAAVQPAARIVAILREPASFLHSLHLQFLQTYVETEGDLRKALALEPARRRGERIPRYTYWPQALIYSDFVRYTEQLERYREAFGRERMLVLIYDDYRRDNVGTVRQLLRFLELDDAVPVRTGEVNLTVQPRSQRLHELVHALSVGRGPLSHAVKRGLKAITPSPLRRRALYATQRRLVFSRPQAPEQALMLELRRRFAGEVGALSEYLGRDLVELWGYDRLS
jgi:hypothetical protein